MRAMGMTGRWGRAAVAAGSVGVAIATAGCGVTPEATSAPAQALTAAARQSGLPIVVSCEPTQRTIVRPTIVNGTAMSQVECVAGDTQAPVSVAARLPGRSEPAVARTLAAPPVYRDIADTEVVPVSARASSAGPGQAPQNVFDERAWPPGSGQKKGGGIRASAGGRGRGGRGPPGGKG